jgi:hypothetical protein
VQAGARVALPAVLIYGQQEGLALNQLLEGTLDERRAEVLLGLLSSLHEQRHHVFGCAACAGEAYELPRDVHTQLHFT